MFRLRAFVVTAAIAALTVSCGGGSSSANNSTSGMSTIMSTGVITGFGSIFVNGIHFQTSAATIRKNGQVVDQSHGDTIKVRGYENPAGSGMVLATRLEREPPAATVIVQGPFMAATSPDFTVLGITINASSAIISNGEDSTLTLADFLTKAVGHSVKVEGTLSSAVITASRIRIDDESGDED